jgi:hypothetical protein
MADLDIIKAFSKVAGIGGVALALFLTVSKEIIRKKIFPTLTKKQAFNVVRLIIVLTWLLAIFGLVAWFFYERYPEKGSMIKVALHGKVYEVKGESKVPIRSARITIDGYPFKATSKINGSFGGTLMISSFPTTVTVRTYHHDYFTDENNIIIDDRHRDIGIILKRRSE